MAATQPNIVFFFWDNFGWGELGCYGGGVLRGAPTPRIDALAAEGLKLLNFNVEAQCTPSRSAMLTGRHAIRSGTQTVPICRRADGLTRWEVTIAQALSDAGYATGMWGKWHLGSDPEQRSPVDFGFDEAVWCPRTADEVLWTMQSYFPDGDGDRQPRMPGRRKIPLEPQPIYSRKKGAKSEVVSTYDAEFRAGFDRKITEWACDFMTRSKEAGKPFYLYLPYTQVHIPPIPDPEYAGKTKRGNWADILTQMDDFTGVILDKLDELGVAEDTIVVWASDNGADPTYRSPVIDPDPVGRSVERVLGPVAGRAVHLARGLEPDAVHHPLAREGARRARSATSSCTRSTCSPTLVKAGGGTVPADRLIDGMDMPDFLLGDAEESGRDIVLCIQGDRLQAVKWHQWKVHLFKQDDFYSTWAPYNMPLLYNLEWDPREEHQVDFPHGWVMHPMAAAAGAFLMSLVEEPPIKPGTPDPYTPPKPVSAQPQTHLQIGPIIQFVTSLVKTHDERAATASRRRASSRMSMSAVDDPQLEVLLACFEGHQRAGKSRRQLGRRIKGGGGRDPRRSGRQRKRRRARLRTEDPRRVVAGTLTPAVTWGVFGLLASGGLERPRDLGGDRRGVRGAVRLLHGAPGHEERAQTHRDALVERLVGAGGVRPWRRCEGAARRRRARASPTGERGHDRR